MRLGNSVHSQLDEKQIIIETLLQNIHKCSHNNIVANSNHKADKVSHEKSKMISNKSNQVDEDGNHNNNDNQKTITKKKMNNL